jgi:hypothetical protein
MMIMHYIVSRQAGDLLTIASLPKEFEIEEFRTSDLTGIRPVPSRESFGMIYTKNGVERMA